MTPWARMRTVFRDYMGSWSSGDKVLAQLFGQGPSSAGVNITEETSLNLSAVWACVQLIAGNLASLPLIHYRKKGNGDRERFTDSKLYTLLHDAPNEEMSAATFLETMQSQVLLWGNAFAEIERDRAGRVSSFYPIEPWRVSGVRPQGLAGDLRYRIAQRDGSDAILRPEEILHVPGLSPNGVWGYSVIRKARESFGLTMAQDQFASTFFGKGSTFGGILSYPGNMNIEQERRLRESLEKRHQGVERAHQFVILQGGVDYKPLGIPGRDAQFLQQRQFQLSEIARWFGVPPHLIGDVEKSTSWGSGIAQQTIGFLQFTLRRWLVKWEKELNRKLISPLERNLQLIEFTVDGLERGDQESRYRAYTVGIQWGFLTRNEVRALENLPRIEGGDTPLVPGNMSTEEKITAPDPKPVAPAALNPAPEPDEDEDDEDERARVLAHDAAAAAVNAVFAKHLDELRPPDGSAVRDAILARLEEVAAENAKRLAKLDERSAATDEATKAAADDMRRELVEQIGRAQTLGEETVARLEALPDIHGARDSILARLEEVAATNSDRLAKMDEDLHAAEARVLEGVDTRLHAEHQSRADRLSGLIPNLVNLIECAVRKEVRFEADRAVRAAEGGPDKFKAWMEAFYAGREDAAVQHLLPIMRLHFQLTGREDAEAETRRLIRGHVEESRAGLEALLGDPENLEANVRMLTAAWEASRPKAVAEVVLKEVLAHA